MRIGPARAEVVAVERDVDVAERHVLVEEVAHELVQAVGEMRAAPVDAHEGDRTTAVLLDHLVRDAYERAADVVLVEDTWVQALCSFLASPDRVKGTWLEPSRGLDDVSRP